MSNKELSGVKDTLFIPLMARCYISKKHPEYFYDEKAIELEDKLPDNSVIDNSSEYTMMGSASRALVMDKIVKEFVKNNHDANIVSIGCGLETMSWRLKKECYDATFYQIDFDSVINKRVNILGQLNNEVFIKGNANDIVFNDYMDCNKATIFVVAGVFHYFKEDDVLSLLAKLQKHFKNSQVLFDATDEFGVKYAARYVKKTGNHDAMMYFCINDPIEFTKKSNTKLLSVQGFYHNVDRTLRRKLKLYTRIAMNIADKKMHAMIIHVQL